MVDQLAPGLRVRIRGMVIILGLPHLHRGEVPIEVHLPTGDGRHLGLHVRHRDRAREPRRLEEGVNDRDGVSAFVGADFGGRPIAMALPKSANTAAWIFRSISMASSW